MTVIDILMSGLSVQEMGAKFWNCCLQLAEGMKHCLLIRGPIF
jgi:hypothetical protein